MHNFYLAPDKWQTSSAATQILEDQEARHLSKVLRIKIGEEIALLDGQGRSGRFLVQNIKKNSVELAPLQIETTERPKGRSWLAAAYTKAARRSWLLEKSVELEAGGIWFWQAERSQAKVPDAGKENWQEQLIAGAKQCFNPWLPELRTFTGGAEQLTAHCLAANYFSRRILLWEDASEDMLLTEADLAATKSDNCATSGDVLFVMGPEGGLSAREVDIFLQHGFKCVSLGKRILRWETAALLCLGLGFLARQRTDC